MKRLPWFLFTTAIAWYLLWLVRRNIDCRERGGVLVLGAVPSLVCVTPVGR